MGKIGKHTIGDHRHHHLQNVIDVEAPLKNKGFENQQSGDESVTNSTGKSTTNSNSCICRAVKWMFILMAVALISAAILFLVINYTEVLDHEKHLCDDHIKNSPFQIHDDQPFKFFGTKTMYSTAYNHLSRAPSQPLTNTFNPSANNINDQANAEQALNNAGFNSQTQMHQRPRTVDKSPIYIPEIFSKKNSLASLDKHLQETSGCRPKQLHFYGRHAARFPNSDSIGVINKDVGTVQHKIAQVIDILEEQERRAVKSQDAESMGSSPSSTSSDEDGSTNLRNKTSPTRICYDKRLPLLSSYKQWQPFAINAEYQANIVTESGAAEAREMAVRFKKLYPDFFDDQKSSISFGVTSELRTAQTAFEFVKSLNSYSKQLNGVCGLEQFPPTNTYDPDQGRKLVGDSCFKAFIDKHLNSNLDFHKRCRSLVKSTIIDDRKLDLSGGRRTQFIADAVSQRLALGIMNQINGTGSTDETARGNQVTLNNLTTEETRALYDACKYESAARGQSIWCNLFTTEELKFYEYLGDIGDFFDQAYGQESQALSACAILRSLGIKLQTTQNNLSTGGTISQEANFHFTHAEAIQRLISASFDLKSDPAYQYETVKEHLDRRTVPEKRQWQTSLLTPFSANLAFILYECPNSTVSSEPAPFDITDEGERSLYVGTSSPLRLVASLNEQPVLLDSCNDYACDLAKLMQRSRMFQKTPCKLEEICARDITIT